ncbi:hypothetical protein FPF71_06615 [Algibacter amylolyticus]|uniref:DUF4258 domain-containing protein n=1 Tax=Algibacter amylolyticus TaxID=1608400 RepID=A0A5M7BEA6_9FLAO|nr:hypothetical protein [Algibacter amylolyticus]KAA5825575.1 hypothetical protein F2B50_06615 [Algibacter amylolyticus]MBB5268200.1 hypothetical protein [Algibacter amylolyticus]TSJ79873.1 hypothetical protein FPF71_06615 [Algibacter amylolyticus]
MSLIQRIGYYLGGFSIGLVILAFFLNGKKTSCSYGPDSRVLKNINSKNLIYSQNISEALKSAEIDSFGITYILKKGDINFSESTPRQEPCGVYTIDANYNKKDVSLVVQNCDSTATLQNLIIKK